MSEPEICPGCLEGKITGVVEPIHPLKKLFGGDFAGEPCYRIFNDTNGRAPDPERYDYCRENNDLSGPKKTSLQKATPQLWKIVRD